MTLQEFYNKWSDFQSLVQATLDRQSDELDKREGSVLYDFAALSDYNISQFSIEIRDLFNQMFLETSSGTYLEDHAKRSGVVRYTATYAKRKGNFYQNNLIVYPTIPFNTEWSGTLADGTRGTWTYIERVDDVDDYEVFVCKTLGTIGNENVLTLTNPTYPTIRVTLQLPPLSYGEDAETDASLLLRTQTVEKTPAYGGNRTDYKEAVEAIDGVGFCQIYPAYQGGGTVLLSIASPSESDPTVSSWLVNYIKEYIDPADAEGTGSGWAPIGHTVDVQSITSETVYFAITDVIIGRSYQEENVRQGIRNALATYFTDLHNKWSTYDPVSYDYVQKISKNQLEHIIMSVDGVIDIMGTVTTYVDNVNKGTDGYSIGVDANLALKKPILSTANTTINFRSRS